MTVDMLTHDLNVFLLIMVLCYFTGSKRGNNPALSGVATNAKGGQLQVFHNGKIVTPQSLLPRKTARSRKASNRTQYW